MFLNFNISPLYLLKSLYTLLRCRFNHYPRLRTRSGKYPALAMQHRAEPPTKIFSFQSTQNSKAEASQPHKFSQRIFPVTMCIVKTTIYYGGVYKVVKLIKSFSRVKDCNQNMMAALKTGSRPMRLIHCRTNL